jgi:hypothetical protein
MYLYEDAARTKPKIFSESYQKVTFYELRKGFRNDGIEIFNTDISGSVPEVVDSEASGSSDTDSSNENI